MTYDDNVILEFVQRYYKKSVNLPDKVPVSGKVYDEAELINGIKSILDGWWTEGRFTKKFIEKFSSFLGVRYVLPVNSGSSANLVAFSALTSNLLGEKRIKPGDEIITVAAAFPTTVNPIIQNGCVPVFIDVNLGTYNIKTELIKEAITEKTKAIFIAHTLGNPYDLSKIKELCDEYDLYLIEDCCDALGSKFNGKFAGTFGDIGTCSFYPAHHITAGEGGAVFTDDSKLKRAIESFRDWGRDCWCATGCDNTCGKRFEWVLGDLPEGYDHKYIYSHTGYNLKWTDMQAAIACAQMDKLDYFIEKRKQNFQKIFDGLKKYDTHLILPNKHPDADTSWFGFPLTIKNSDIKRNKLITYLNENGVATRLLFSGNIIKQPYFKNQTYRVVGTLENTDKIMHDTFWIGCYPGLTDENIVHIINTFDNFMNKVNAE